MKFWNHRIGLLGVIAVIYFIGNLHIDRFQDNITRGDSGQYYLHVLSFFLYEDVGSYDRTLGELKKLYPNIPDPRDDKYGIRPTEKGRYYIKYTLGVPVMETPFFLLAHAYVKASGKYPANGWSRPYQWVLGLSTLCYLLIGFYLLAGILERYFSRQVAWLTCLTIAFATNLFYHGTYVIMAHGFLFFDYCLLLALTLRFYERPNIGRALCVGLAVGLIGITRVPEVISVLIPLLWGVKSRAGLYERILFFLRNFKLSAAIILGILLVFSIQINYWHYVSGKLIFNPYQGEGFNFLDPKVHRAWFDAQNGWLIYTPVMIFSLIGLRWLGRYVEGALLPVLLFVGLHAYIHYSYYAWTFFPGLGQRPMVETYPLLAFGLAACFAQMHKRKSLAWLPVALLIPFSILNFFQTWQMDKGIIWSERHNWAFFASTFGATKSSLPALRAYDSGYVQPDSSSLAVISTVVTDSFSSEKWDTLVQAVFGHPRAIPIPRDYLDLAKDLRIPPDTRYLGISVSALAPEAGRVWNRDPAANLMMKLLGPDGKELLVRSVKPSTHVGNPEYTIWSAGEVNQWGSAGFFMKVPRSLPENSTLYIYTFNPDGQPLFLDDLVVKAYKCR